MGASALTALFSFLFAAPAFSATATYAVMESIPSHGGAIRVSTGTGNHVAFSTAPYRGSVGSVGIYTSSNVVLSTQTAPNIVLYATGSVTGLGLLSTYLQTSTANFSGSGTGVYSVILGSGIWAGNACIQLQGGQICGPAAAATASTGAIVTSFNGTTSNTKFSLAYATVTFTTAGGFVKIGYAGGVRGPTGNLCTLNVIEDGQYLSGYTPDSGMIPFVSPGNNLDSNASFTIMIRAPSAGQHSYALQLASPSAGSCVLSNTASATNMFWGHEL